MTPTPITIPTKPTLYHAENFSSCRALNVLLELGLVATKKRKAEDGGVKDDGLVVAVETVTWDQLKKDPVLGKLNPQRRLPFFFDPTKDDLSLNESGGLVQYILETYDNDHKLHPTLGDKTRPEFLKLLHFGPATAYHVGVHLLFPGTEKEVKEKKGQWHDVVAPTLKQALSKFGGPYLLGDKFSAADAVIGYDLVTVAAAKCSKELFEPHPELQAYHDKLKSRPAYQEVYPANQNKGESGDS